MLTLDQNESNFLYWTKGWYEDKSHETFWPQLKILHEDYTDCEGDIADLYWYVRRLWKKIIKATNNEEFLTERYESETLPQSARYYRGAPNYNENQSYNRSFNAEEIIQARIAIMCSQMKLTKVEYYKALPPTDLEGLKMTEDSRQRLQQMFDSAAE